MQSLHSRIRRSFSVPYAPLSMLDGSGGTGCDEVCFPVHGGWKGNDVSMAGVCDRFGE